MMLQQSTTDQMDVFRALTVDQLERIQKTAREKHCGKGDVVFHQGTPAESIYLVLEGHVGLVYPSESGHAQAACVVKTGEIFCCLPAMDQGEYPATAVAGAKSRILQIPMGLFQSLLAENETFRNQTLCQFCSQLRSVEQKACASMDPVERRLANTLLILQKKFGDTLPLTKQEIADLCGTTVETTIRTLRVFEHQGILSSKRGEITILHAQALELQV